MREAERDSALAFDDSVQRPDAEAVEAAAIEQIEVRAAADSRAEFYPNDLPLVDRQMTKARGGRRRASRRL